MQIDLVPEVDPSGGYQNIDRVMHVFCRCLFVYSTINQDADAVGRVIVNIRTKHAYLPTTIFSDKGSAFVSQVIKGVRDVVGITLNHATTKRTQTIGILERTYVSLKKALIINTGERRSLRHKDVNIAVLNYNTSCHTNIGCEPSRVFHRRVP